MNSLYDQDFVLWAEHQANLIQAKQFEKLDLENLVEEIEDMGKSIKRALESQLERLMMHVIKWKIQPAHRSNSWRGSIYEARKQIRRSRKKTPSLNENFIKSIWQECFENATEDAEDETGLKSTIENLTWQEVFEDEYFLNQTVDE